MSSRNLTRYVVTCACAGLLASGSLLNAADPPATPVSPASPTTGGAPQGEGRLTSADLPTLLTNLGYEPVADGTSWRISIQRDGWTLAVSVGVFNNDRNLWIYGYVADLPASTPPERLIAILQTNNQIGPTHFFVVPREGVNQLFVGKAIENRGLRPSIIRAELDAWCTTVINTQPVWDSRKWTTAEPTTGPTTMPQ